MMTFEDLNLTTPLRNALNDLGFTHPTPIQTEVFSSIASGRDVVGVAQTGTGKTLIAEAAVYEALRTGRR